jgi:hypothetical protein
MKVFLLSLTCFFLFFKMGVASDTSLQPRSFLWPERLGANALQFTWKNSQGAIVKSPVGMRMSWVWKKEGKFEKPYVSLQIQKPGLSTSESPILIEPVATNVEIFWKGAQGEDQKYFLSLQPKVDQSPFFIHPQCKQRNIEILATQAPAPTTVSSWVSAFCFGERDQLKVAFYQAGEEYRFNMEGRTPVFDTSASSPRGRWTFFVFDQKDSDAAREKFKPLGELRVLGGEVGETIHLIQSIRKGRREAYGLFPAVGVTYVNYAEPGRSIQLSQMAMTARLSGFVRLRPNWLRIEGDGFVDAAPFSISDGAPAAARFMGGAARLGVSFTQWVNHHTFDILGGYSVLKMIVPNDAFGVSLLSGFQFLLRFSSDTAIQHPYSIQAGITPLIEQDSSIQLGKRTLFVAGAYQIFSVRSLPVDLTLQIAQTHFSSVDTFNELTMTSLFSGLQFGI